MLYRLGSTGIPLLALLLAASPVPAQEGPAEPKAGDAPPPQEAEKDKDGKDPGPLTDIECLGQNAATAPMDTTVGALRQWCLDNGDPSERQLAHDALRARLALEERSQFNPFVLTPHKRNYVLPWSNWSIPDPENPERGPGSLQPNEVKFQVSLKTPIVDEALGRYTFYGALTITSFWQAYNEKLSKPFRETNYAPSLFVTRPVDWQLGPVDSELLSAGYIHESNGQPLPTSRSWDRLFVSYVFRTGQYYWQFKPWYRIPEPNGSRNDPERDDNPNITDYMGDFELTVARPFSNHVVELMVRNNLELDENRGAGQIDYSFPINQRFKGLFQVFTGYGDSLIHYDRYVTRVSIGILLTDTL